MTDERSVRVLCIAATGQSGSTLLARLLGEVPGFRAVGEVGRIWDKGVDENMACSCGQPFRSCEFWGAVGDRAFGGWDAVDGRDTARLRDELAMAGTRFPHFVALPFLRRPELWPSFRDKASRYADLMRPVYQAMHEVTGGEILVDSMKIPSHVYLMTSAMPTLDVRIAHHIRDSRGFAYSNTKWVEKQGGEHRGSFRGRRPPWRSALRWNWFNEAFDHLRRTGVPSVRVRYEDLVHDPIPQLRRASDLFGVGLSADDLGFVHDDGVDFSPGHIGSGSRWRMTSGRIPLREDTEWATRLGDRDRRVVTAVTRPWLHRYGYRIEGALHTTTTEHPTNEAEPRL